MLKFSAFFFAFSLAIIAGLSIHFNDHLVEVSYVGVQSCQSCHSSLSSGFVFQEWDRGPHRSAFQLLESDSIQQYLATNEIGVDNCLECHSTLGRAGINEFERELNSEGIGCERCHGPGSQYIETTIMKKKGLMESFGGSQGDLADCYSCHAGTPELDENACPFQTSTFDADSAWKKMKHDSKLH